MLQVTVVCLPMHQPGDIDGLVQPDVSLVRSIVSGRIAYEESGAGSGLYVPGRCEAIVGLYHRELADAVTGGKLPDGGQTRLGTKLAIIHKTLNPLHDLFGECPAP